jgi:eukaryotic-like serine/threonine-protein kinase
MDPIGINLQLIFCGALEQPAGPERSAYLDRICGEDAAVRLQVESLLKAHAMAGGSVASGEMSDDERPSGDLPPMGEISSAGDVTVDHTPEPENEPAVSSTQPVGETLGATVGRYKLMQKIGEGGMGAVFIAEQKHPVRRRVALKVIKPGLDTGQVVARFEAERQALAIMDHQNIARILDVGATDAGRPFFVMDLVKGVPITEYCDRNHLAPTERLELFIPVCQAIQHAHQKGIIHRDIKPSNVLVTLQDGTPVPKVIDFGVAKAIDQRLCERTMFTEIGQLVGTLEYMSPEQAEMGALDIDTRSDIYSLGVLLYELLSGSTPLERAKVRNAAFAEIVKRICEEEPAKPSTRLSQSKDKLPSIAARRKMEPTRLTKFVRGELDWIVMKSLEKDRTRRYETANAFARDIQRFLQCDPVEACPASASYKLKKFARKHRAALATAGAFALLLVIATVISTYLALRANRELKRAEDREALAILGFKRFRDAVVESPDLKRNPSLGPLRKILLKEPLSFFKTLRDQLLADGATRPESVAALASATFELARLTEEIGNKHDALQSYEESLTMRKQLARENPSSNEFQSDLAESHDNVGVLLGELGQPANALTSHQQARVIRDRLVRENPSVTEFQRNLAGSHNNIGALHYMAGRLTDALTSYESARAIQERLVRENPSVTQFQGHLAKSHYNISVLHREAGRPEEALAAHQQASAVLERLASENPSATDFRIDLARNHFNIAKLHDKADRRAEALASYQQARAIQERLARENPSVTQIQAELAMSLGDIGAVESQMGRLSQALASFEQARSIRVWLVREQPDSPNFANDLASTLNNMARILLIERRFDEARATVMEAIEWRRKSLALEPAQPAYRQALIDDLKLRIQITQVMGRLDESQKFHRELRELAATDPATAIRDSRLVAVLRGQEPIDDSERIQLASRAYERTLYSSSARLYAEALARSPKLWEDRRTQHGYSAACAAALAAAGQGTDDAAPEEADKSKLRQQAREWLQRELVAWRRVLDDSPTDMKELVLHTLQHWNADADLAGIRDEKELAKLPAEERAALRQFWNEVDQLAKTAAGPIVPLR